MLIRGTTDYMDELGENLDVVVIGTFIPTLRATGVVMTYTFVK